MSVTKLNRSVDIVAAVIYAAYGTRKNAKNHELRAERMEIFAASGTSDPMTFATAGRDEVKRHWQRKNQALLYTFAWSPDELDVTNEADLDVAMAAAGAVVQDLVPNSDVALFLHTDSKAQHVHVHAVAVNHDNSTGKSAPERADNYWVMRAVNDKTMPQFGLEVCEQNEVSLSQHEYRALRAGIEIEAAGLELHELTADTWRSYMRNKVLEACEDERVIGADSADDGLLVLQEIASEYDLQVDYKWNEDDLSKSTVAFTLIDDQGEPLRVSITSTQNANSKRSSVRRRKCYSAGKKLGSDFKASTLHSRIAVMQKQQQVERDAMLIEEQALADAEITREFGYQEGKKRGTEDAKKVLAEETKKLNEKNAETKRLIEQQRRDLLAQQAAVRRQKELVDSDRKEASKTLSEAAIARDEATKVLEDAERRAVEVLMPSVLDEARRTALDAAVAHIGEQLKEKDQYAYQRILASHPKEQEYRAHLLKNAADQAVHPKLGEGEQTRKKIGTSIRRTVRNRTTQQHQEEDFSF